MKIAPSLLSADFSRLADEIASVEEHADLLHLDVMDGHFVPNITIGPAIVKACRKVSKLPFDCHLMIEHPQLYIERFLEAGANMISIHVEAEPHLQRALQLIREGGAKAGKIGRASCRERGGSVVGGGGGKRRMERVAREGRT